MTLNPGSFDALLPGYPAALFDLLSRELQLPHPTDCWIATRRPDGEGTR
ncbi:MAG TPA: hypothetical protein VKU35_02470 [Candidatus Limnocylindria bacterium]|nr:hypothetical protein [Candidatus Limnocylindria bacterium]